MGRCHIATHLTTSLRILISRTTDYNLVMFGAAGLRSVCGTPVTSRHHAQHNTLCAAHNARHQDASEHAPACKITDWLASSYFNCRNRRRRCLSASLPSQILMSGHHACSHDCCYNHSADQAPHSGPQHRNLSPFVLSYND